MGRRFDPVRDDPAYRQLWRVVDGAVRDAFDHHPDYLTAKGARNARRSINKRVVGAVLGYAEQSARGRSGGRPAAVEVAPSQMGSHVRAKLPTVARWWRGWASGLSASNPSASNKEA